MIYYEPEQPSEECSKYIPIVKQALSDELDKYHVPVKVRIYEYASIRRNEPAVFFCVELSLEELHVQLYISYHELILSMKVAKCVIKGEISRLVHELVIHSPELSNMKGHLCQD